MINNRKNLIKTLNDSSSVLKSMDILFKAIAIGILLFPILGLFNVQLAELWIGLSSIILAFTFIFGNAAKRTFESILFIYQHKFHVGDVVSIDNSVYTIKEIHLMYTKVERWDGANIDLDHFKLYNEINIINYTTSTFHSNTYSLYIDCGCINENLIKDVNYKMKNYIESLPDKFRDISITVRDFNVPYKARLVLFLQHNYPNNNPGRTILDFSNLLIYYIQILNQLNITYSYVHPQTNLIGNEEEINIV